MAKYRVRALDSEQSVSKSSAKKALIVARSIKAAGDTPKIKGPDGRRLRLQELREIARNER